jgi:hypothetical protein
MPLENPISVVEIPCMKCRSSLGAIAAGFFSDPPQNTRMRETPFTEHNTAQSV